MKFCPSFVSVLGGGVRKGRGLAGASAGSDSFGVPPAPTLASTAKPYGILITGVGGTGVVTIGALIGMAAHIDGKGVTVLDMTGLAQKGGATWSHIQIANRQGAIYTTKVDTAKADLVIGSRVRGRRQPGALSPQARFGNWLSCLLIRLIWGFRFTDLGPFRAIRYPALLTLDMQDRDYGWTVEMQVKAISHKLRVLEVPVAYNRRIGKSKISGTLRGVLGAGAKILFTIFKQAITRRNRRHP